MNPQLALYQDFIDRLVGIREGVLGRWIMEKGWPDLPQNREINDLLSRLSTGDKQILAGIVRDARDGGIHDTLAILNDRVNLNGLRLIENGVEMAVEPYDTELYYDWVCRCAGDPWPERPQQEQYK